MKASAEHDGLWGALEERLAEPSNGRADVWDHVEALIDPTQWRPALAADIEIKEFRLRWGNDYAMVANPRDLVHYRLTPEELATLRLMDGSRTVGEIVVERLRASGDLDVESVADLVRDLHEGNFLQRRFMDLDEAVRRALDPVSAAREKGRTFVRTLSIEWKDAERLVRWLYRYTLRWFFTPWAQIPAALLAGMGLFAFVSVALADRFSLSGESLALGALILLALNYVLTFLHELGHATVLVHEGRRVKSAGFMIYFGAPAFFVDASDGLMMDPPKRMLQAFAGPYVELIVAGAASIVAWAFPDMAISRVLYAFAVLNYLVLFLNLVPLLELDGYWILSDLIQVPDLRPMSLSFVRHDFWHKLRERERFSWQEVGLAAYGIAGVLFTIFAFYTAFYFWEEIFGGLISRLWNGGAITRLLLLVLVIFLAGPAIRGSINLLRAGARRIRALWGDLRFRLQRGWRVEAANLIDALPLFDDLDEDVLGELAGSVRQQTVSAGEPVFRQGDRATAFYVVRSGAVNVVDEQPDSPNERVLRTLGRGDSFGELGLLEGAARSATVRALEECRLFVVGKGDFDRLLADVIRVPELLPTAQELVELRSLPCFAHLSWDQVSDLRDHGEWLGFPARETIVRQGEPGNAFYAIGAGQVEVFEDGERVRILGPGSYLGEIALLLDVPRTATAVTVTPTRIFRLDREGFDGLMREAFGKGRLRPHVPVDRTWQH